MAARLTPNGIAAINAGDLDLKPVLQVMEVTNITGSQERFRIMVSDGSTTHQALLATQLNDLARAGKVRRGSVVQLLEYICSTVQSRRMIIILNMEVLIMESEVFGKLDHRPEAESANQKPSLLKNSSFKGDQLRNGTSLSSNNKGQSYPPMVQPSYKPPPNYRNHGAIAKNEAPARTIPIAALNPYQGRWAIKARVTAKGELRRYNNARGDGKVFSFDLLDSDGGEIRVTCFNAIVDRFYGIIEAGKVYMISKGSLKPAQKNFNHLSNDWEIFLETSSIVEHCPEEDGSIPAQQFNFKEISDIVNAENNSIVDLIGIVISITLSVTILRKNGMETQRRIVNLKDKSGMSVELTLWGDFCGREGRNLQELLDSGDFPCLAVKAGKVSDFSGKSVGTISSSQLFINPDIPEVLSLRDWFDNGGKDISSNSISRETMAAGFPRTEIRKNVSQIKDEGLGRGDKPDWVTLKATVSFIKTENFCYTACPLMIGERRCSKKVSKLSNGNWCCERCDREFEECEYRYLLQFQVQDHTGLTWVTAFQDSGEEILRCSAEELFMLKEDDDPKFAEIIRSCLFVEFLFRMKIKEEHYGEEQRVKITVVSAEKVSPSTESKYLLDEISKFNHITSF